MNFYKHHIGDYAQATSHLTFAEDAAYSRLLRKYYADEQPIHGPLKAAQRLAGARSREEREAVETVLDEFFEYDQSADVWRNKRADEELARYRSQAENNRRIAEEREARKRERIAKAKSTNRADDANEAFNESCNESSRVREPSHKPLATSQNQEQAVGNTSLGEVPRTREAPRADRPPKPIPANAQACIAMREAGAARVNPSHPTLLAGIAEGATPAMYGDAVREAIDGGKGEPFAYAIATVRSRLADAKRQPIPQENRHGPRHATSAVAETLDAIRRQRQRRAEAAGTAPAIEHDAG